MSEAMRELKRSQVYVLMFVVVLACYAIGLSGPAFLVDEYRLHFELTPAWDDPTGVLDLWSGGLIEMDGHYRPVSDSVFWLCHQLWGESPLGYRLLNLGLHLLAVVLAIRVMRRLGLPAPEWCGFFIAIHPIAVQSVLHCVNLNSALANALLVASALALVRQHDQQSWRWGVASLLLLALAILSKSTATSFPMVVVVLGLILRIRPSRQTWLFVAASFVIAGALGLLDAHLLHEFRERFGETTGFEMSLHDRVVKTAASSLQYLRNALVPHPFGLYYDVRIDAIEWLCLFAVAATLVWSWVSGGRHRALQAIGVVVAFLLTVAPAMVGHTTWLYSPAQDRYQQLGTFVLVPAIVAALATMGSSPRFDQRKAVLAAALGIVLAGACAFRVRTYHDPQRFFERSARILPHSAPLRFAWLDAVHRDGNKPAVMRVLERSQRVMRDGGMAHYWERMRALILLKRRSYLELLSIMPIRPGEDVVNDSVVAAIMLESPDSSLRDPQRAEEVIDIMAEVHARNLEQLSAWGSRWRGLWIDALRASLAAARGDHVGAIRWLDRILRDRAMSGRGELRAQIRQDLLRRLLAYARGGVVSSPESMLLWTRAPDS